MQCIYCQVVRAKNTSRQKQHLLECPGLRGHPDQQLSQPAQVPNGIGAPNGYPGTPNGPTGPAGAAGAGTIGTPNGTLMTNGVNPHATPLQAPLQALQNRAMATPVPPTGPPSAPPSAAPSRPTPKPKSKNSTSSLPAPPLDDVHAAFVEFRYARHPSLAEHKLTFAFFFSVFRAKEEDKVSTITPCSSYPHTNLCPFQVSQRPMYLLPERARQEHVATATAPS